MVNFWLGSSAGSQNKDAAAISLQRTQSQNTKEAVDALSKKAAAPPIVVPAAPPIAVAAAPARAAAQAQNTGQDGAQRFDACMPIIIRMEGESERPGDPGGATNFGITLNTLRAWENNNSLTAQDVKALTESQAKEIYRTDYLNKMQCGSLSCGLDLEVFDFGVNAGPGRAVKSSKRSLE